MVMRIGGLVSGMDIDAIVEQLMSARRAPVDKLYQQRQTLQWQRESYRNINTKLYDFRNNKLSNYRLQGTFLKKTVALSGNTTAIEAKAGPTANGSMTVVVNQLATAATAHSGSDIRLKAEFDPSKSLASQIAAGNISDFSSTEFYINGTRIEIDKDNDSLNDIISKINRLTDVTAYYDKNSGKIAFSSKNTGLVNAVNNPDSEGGKYITFSHQPDESSPYEISDFVTNVLKINGTSPKTAAQNAELTVTINGLEMAQTSSSNRLTVNGVELTLKEAGGAATVINVSTDVDGIVETIKNFISDYNEMLKTLTDTINEKRYRDYPPLTDAQKKEMSEDEIKLWEEKAKSGLLRNDPILSKAVYQMRISISSQVETGSNTYKTLSSIGIVTGDYSENGKLYLQNESKLRKAIEEDPEAVMRLFAGTGTDTENRSDVGIAKKMYDDLQNAMKAITEKIGSVAAESSYRDESPMGRQLYELDKRIDAMEERLQALETRYYRQFTAMESAINRYNAQSMYLQNAFGGYQ